MKRPPKKRLLWICILFLSFLSCFIVLLMPEPSLSQTWEEAEELAEQYTALCQEYRFREAIPLAEKALAILEESLGPEHPSTMQALYNLLEIYLALGDDRNVETLRKRSMEFYETSYGPDHPNTALALRKLADMYYRLGNYAKAEPLYKRSLAVYEKLNGPDHPSVAALLRNLAELHGVTGDYAKAEPLYKRSLAIVEKIHGSDNPNIIVFLDSLADHYTRLGDHQKAECLLKRCLALREKMPDSELAIADALHNLASLYLIKGDYAKVSPMLERSVVIYEKTLGPEHPHTATGFHSLAILYRNLGDYENAESLHRRSLAVYEKLNGPEHPSVAASLNNLALLYHAMGDYAKAEPLFKRSLAIREKTLGVHHPYIASTLDSLSLLCAATGKYADAFSLMLRAQGIDRRLIDQVMGFTSEDQKMKFLATKENSLYIFLNLVSQYVKDDKDAVAKSLTIWLQRKGMVLEAQKRFQEALALSDDPKVTQTARELAWVRGQLSKLTFSGPGKEGADAYRRKIRDLEVQKERLEAELSKMSDAFAKTRKMGKADTWQVADALPKGSSFVDFVKLPMFNLTAKGKESKWLPPRYYAFILPSGKADNVSLVELGDAGEIDRLVFEFKKNIGNYQGDPQGKETSLVSRRLYDRVFTPLSKELKEVRDVYISPDGNLNIIPFEVLEGPDGRYLVEDYTFNYLGSGRDLLGFGMIKGRSSKPLVIGDPDYDLDETGQKVSLRKLGIAVDKRSFITRSRDLSSKEFPPLTNTKQEVESIASLMGKKDTSLYTGKDALEGVLFAHKDPKVIHLATHGFFISDQDLLDDKRKTPYENPLVRSGIVLAGANTSIKSGSDEGIVTAERILSLRLHGTDLVVLSACETGLGDIKSGEGVFGLRRAFTQAGAKGIVMSMWSVPDKETKELMVNFYANVLVKKMKRSQALRQAILTELSEVKKRYGSANPFFWGAFVYLGEP